MLESSRDITKKAIKFERPSRIPLCLSFDDDPLNEAITRRVLESYSSDIIVVSCKDPEFMPEEEGLTQWGYRWETMGETMGEVKDNPIKNWDMLGEWMKKAPDFTTPSRYYLARKAREQNPDKYLVGHAGFMMTEVFLLRGFYGFMTDLYLERDNLDILMGYMYTQGKNAVDGFAGAGMDAIIVCEDWGFQDRPMIDPKLWYEVFYDPMKAFVDHIHNHGMAYILHSCGHILDYLDYFVEMGVDVIQMDQQHCMGLDKLSKWRGKLCFFSPVDIQFSPVMDGKQIVDYANQMIEKLSSEKGGFMYKAYGQPAAIHMPTENIISEIRAFKSIHY